MYKSREGCTRKGTQAGRDTISTQTTHNTGQSKTPIKLLFTIADSATRLPVEKEFKKYTKTQKDSQGQEKRYLCGVMSGLGVDAHGEKMSEKAIQGMIDQTKEKDITLYVNHGKDFTQDIGILRTLSKLENGDLYAEFELYDNNPESDKVWAQANGLPPYKHTRQFGFSIEGYVPEDMVKDNGTGKTIDFVDLDPGVSLVSKPAYTPSIVQAIQKAFTRKSGNLFESGILSRQKKKDFYNTLEEIEEIMSEAEEKILSSSEPSENKESQLRNAYESYINRKVQLYKELDFNIPYILEENPPSGLPVPSEVQGLENSEQKNQTTKEGTEMSEEMKAKLAEIMAMLQGLVQVEQAEGELLEASEEATPDEAKSILEKSKVKSKKKSKLLQSLVRKSEELLKEAEEEEAKAKEEEEEEAIKEILKEVDEPEAEPDSNEQGIIDVEDITDDLDSELQEQVLAKAFGFDPKFVRTLMTLQSKKSKGEKPVQKSTKAVLLAKELANTKKQLNALSQMIQAGNVQPQAVGQSVQKGLAQNSGQNVSLQDIQNLLNGNQVNKNLQGTVSENSELVMKSILGGR